MAYEQSAAERQILEAKAARRTALRAAYLKESSNPFNHGQGGVLFDPAMQRYEAMRVSHFEHFKPTGLSLRTGFLCVVAPILLYTWWMKSDRDRREHAFRTGQIAYKDREFKFI